MFASYKVMWKYAFNFYSLENKKTFWQAFGLHFAILLLVWLGGALWAPLLILALLYSVCSLVPVISLAVRRLHDTDTTGLYLFMIFIPIAGIVFVTLKLLEKSNYNPEKIKVKDKTKPDSSNFENTPKETSPDVTKNESSKPKDIDNLNGNSLHNETDTDKIINENASSENEDINKFNENSQHPAT